MNVLTSLTRIASRRLVAAAFAAANASLAVACNGQPPAVVQGVLEVPNAAIPNQLYLQVSAVTETNLTIPAVQNMIGLVERQGIRYLLVSMEVVQRSGQTSAEVPLLTIDTRQRSAQQLFGERLMQNELIDRDAPPSIVLHIRYVPASGADAFASALSVANDVLTQAQAVPGLVTGGAAGPVSVAMNLLSRTAATVNTAAEAQWHMRYGVSMTTDPDRQGLLVGGTMAWMVGAPNAQLPAITSLGLCAGVSGRSRLCQGAGQSRQAVTQFPYVIISTQIATHRTVYANGRPIQWNGAVATLPDGEWATYKAALHNAQLTNQQRVLEDAMVAHVELLRDAHRLGRQMVDRFDAADRIRMSDIAHRFVNLRRPSEADATEWAAHYQIDANRIVTDIASAMTPSAATSEVWHPLVAAMVVQREAHDGSVNCGRLAAMDGLIAAGITALEFNPQDPYLAMFRRTRAVIATRREAGCPIPLSPPAPAPSAVPVVTPDPAPSAAPPAPLPSAAGATTT